MGLLMRLLVFLLCTMGWTVQTAQAQDLLGSYRKWDALRARTNEGLVCYMISEPERWSASRKGVRRGDIYILITHKPDQKIRDEVNIIIGYPFRTGSEARARIDKNTEFRLFTQGDGAWNADRKDDRAMVAAMKKGLAMVVTGTSSRGTTTTDTYSLSGFTAAHNAISDACRV